MPDFGTFDYGTSVSRGTQNALAEMQVRDAVRNRKQGNVLAQMRGQALSGDTDALKQIAAIDPEAGTKLQDFLSKSDQAQRERVGFSSRVLGAIAFKADTAEKWNEGMKYAKEAYGIDTSKFMDKFSAEEREKAIAMSNLTDKAIKMYGAMEQVPGTDLVGQKELQSGEYTNLKTAEDAGLPGGAGGGSKLKGYEYSELGKHAARYFPESSIYDANGNFVGFKEKAMNAPKINRAITQAMKVLRDNPKMVIGEAVDQELEKAGLISPQAGAAATQKTAAQTYKEGQTATGPNGQQIIYRYGQWVPIK